MKNEEADLTSKRLFYHDECWPHKNVKQVRSFTALCPKRIQGFS
jgi:hypothetical protein